MGLAEDVQCLPLFFFSTFMCFLLIRKPVNEKENLAIWSKLMSS